MKNNILNTVRNFKFAIATFTALLLAGGASAQAQTSYTGTASTGIWNSTRWNNTSDISPYGSAWIANNAASFAAGAYTFTSAATTGVIVNVGNITLASGATVTFSGAGGTIATSATRTLDIGSGSLLDFGTQAFSTAVGTGFIKNGAGVLATSGGGFSGGFTLNAGTVIMRGVDAMGASASNVLTLNGGTVASNGSRSMTTAKYGGGIVIGGNVQFGELATNVTLASSTADLSFANNVSLGTGVRTFTLGNNGNQTFSGIISNSSGGINFSATAGVTGKFAITGTANTFTGPINITAGEVQFTTDGSIGNAANDIIIDGGRFGKGSDTTSVTLGAGRDIFVGDGVGTSISSAGGGTLIYNNVIANKSGETGSWAKQGSGTLSLGGVSTYSGDTAINNGILLLTTGNNRLPTGTVVSLGQAAANNLGTLDLNGQNQSIAGLVSTAGTSVSATLKNTVTSGTAATLDINVADGATKSYGDGTTQNSGVIAGAIALTKSGLGTQVLGDANTYSGATTISNGVLNIRNSAGLGATNAGTTVANLAALELQNGISVGAEALTLNGTGVSSGGALRNISGNNTYGGLLALGSASRINSDSGTLSLTNAGTVSGAFALTVGGAGDTVLNSILGTSTGTLTKDGAGKFTMGGANTFTGLTTVSNGTLAYGVGNALSSGAVTVNGSGAVLDIATFSDTVGAVTLTTGSITGTTGVLTGTSFAMDGTGSASAILGGSGATLTKTGAGTTTTLSGANTYTGATTVTSGTLAVNGSLLNSGSVVVNASGFLGGSGSVGAITGAGTVGPGNSPGILTATSVDPTLGTDFKFEFTALSPTYTSATSSGNDLLHLTSNSSPFAGGTFASGNIVSIYLNNAAINSSLLAGTNTTFSGGFFVDGTYALASALTPASFAYYTTSAALGTGSAVDYNGTIYYALDSTIAAKTTLSDTTVTSAGFTTGTVATGTLLTFNAVPEPSTQSMLAFGMVALVAVRALRRSREDS